MNTARMTLFESPFLLGFDEVERMVGDILRYANDSYPPYNIEHDNGENYHITLAVAGFSEDDLSVTLEKNKLTITGKKKQAKEDPEGVFIHRGIAARQFERRFVLAEGLEIVGARLENGLLNIALKRPLAKEEDTVQNIAIDSGHKDKSATLNDLASPSKKVSGPGYLKAT